MPLARRHRFVWLSRSSKDDALRLLLLRFKHFSGVDDTPENRSQFLSNVPLGRLCEARDVANACLFFAADESDFVTGINMEVDGGRAI
jgi:NAD(P)-dependent dehydrogenase (short-subunit alcohol dehydrogenase family)